jgi:predicted transcriptional regulator
MNARQEALIRHGGNPPRCAWCGGLESLEIDHISGNGGIHRRDMAARGTHLVYELRRLGYPRGYQILCHACHVIKSYGKEVCMVYKNGNRPKNLSLSEACIEQLRDLATKQRQDESAIVEQAIEHEIEGPNGKGAVRLGMLHQRQGDLLTAMETLTARIDTLIGQVHAVDGRLARVEVRLDTMERKGDTTKGVLDRIVDTLKSIEAWTQKSWIRR